MEKSKTADPYHGREFDYAVQRFIELHGDLRLAHIKRSHVREFREALQTVPLHRKGTLQRAKLPVLIEWSRAHPDAKRIGHATVNKLLGGVQAVTVWGRLNGLIPEDVPWSDPFTRMRLDEEEPSREPWDTGELQVLFTSEVFFGGSRPKGGRGEAAYWLPILALYTGARLGELAPLSADDIRRDDATGVTFIDIAEDEARGARLKTQSSRRVVPLHPELEKLGFLRLVEERRTTDGPTAALFPLLTRGPRGGYADQWSKWFGRYIRGIGIANPDRVFHSFRHSFKDALRAAGVSEDINDALTGHSGGGVGRSYGAKSVVRRFGLQLLAAETAKATYPGLDLSHLYPTG
jgi:integrase